MKCLQINITDVFELLKEDQNIMLNKKFYPAVLKKNLVCVYSINEANHIYIKSIW